MTNTPRIAMAVGTHLGLMLASAIVLLTVIEGANWLAMPREWKRG